jgi:FkbM family methyltransferase
MNVAASSSVSSFLDPTEDYTRSYPEARTVRREEIEVATLDDVAGNYSYQGVFLKSDTQGYDLRVLRGAIGVLQRAVGVQNRAFYRSDIRRDARLRASTS